MAAPQNRGIPHYLNLDEFGEFAADDPEMTDEYSRQAKLGYQEIAKLRQEAWDRSVRKIMLLGTNGYISDQLGAIDRRPALSNAEVERLMADCQDGTLSNEDDAVDELPEAYQDIFEDSFSAPVDNLRDASHFLEIDPDTGRISNKSRLILRPDQIQNVAFMVKHGEGILRGCINANPCGTGKTMEGLAAIYFLAKRNAAPKKSSYKPALILCPAAAMKSWQRDYNRYFRQGNLLTLHVFNGRGAGSADIIRDAIESLDSNDPNTSNHVFLFTYSTFASRFLEAKRNDLQLVLFEKLSNIRSKLVEEQIEAFRTAEKFESFDINLSARSFGVCIADEAHNIKDPKTQKAHTVYLVEAHINFLLTASPMPNRLSDLRGLLFALFRSEEWQLDWPEKWTASDVCKIAFSKAFKPVKLIKGHSLVPGNSPDDYKKALREGHQLWCLNPALYRWLGHRYDFRGRRFTERVLGLIFRTCVLCRSQKHSVVSEDGKAINLSQVRGIPACIIKTVEVEMNDDESKFYHSRSKWYFRTIYTGDTRNFESAAKLVSRNEVPKAGFNKTTDWRLGCLTVSPGLAQITRLKTPFSEVFIRGQKIDFDEWARRNNDLGLSFYYHLTRGDDEVKDPPEDRLAMVNFMLKGSPKMRWLFPKLWQWKNNGEKAVIFVVHPLAQWMIERVCLLVGGFNFLSVTSSLSATEREEVFSVFNNPAKHYNFLIVPMSIGGTSIELQNDCHKAVIFELPDSFPTILNAIGRIHRVRQRHQQEVIILSLAESYDDFTLSRAFRKFAKELCSKEGFTQAAVGLRTCSRKIFDLLKRKNVSAREVLAGELIRRKFGMQWNRLGDVRFGQWHNLAAYHGDEYDIMTRCGKVLFQRIVNGDEEVEGED
ncbi:hypothetical protein N0V93_001723 [Gnomoniopsis smithogilvyi]|uniref:Helicase ATP-binding domain-containing protein n=1 Tax=Gnomoniopsis smithogilvyi TaxID=1191159 RepID=A0A9W8Z4H5_9PEZI|nr:hypothetical protein N0V93_001723 [Gnomoniopsis smithogilvyi]